MAATYFNKLHRALSEYPLKRKILLCTSYAEGHQLLERISTGYGPVLNTEIETLEGLVAKRTRLELHKRGLTALTGRDAYWITYSLLGDLVREQQGFLAVEQLTPGLIRAFHQALLELREAGITSGQLDEDCFENSQKGHFLHALLARYEKVLEGRKLADFAVLVHLLPEGTIVRDTFITHEAVLAARMKQEAFNRLSGGAGTILPLGQPFLEADSCFPLADIRMFQAGGVLAEVREVFRRMLEQNHPWDQTEIILSDYAGGISAVHATSVQLGVECTYGEGLPVRFSEVGKAALHLLDWLESDYNADHLLAAFRGGHIGLWEDEVSPALAARVLDKAGVGWGMERYGLLREYSGTDPEQLKAAAALYRWMDTGFKAIGNESAVTPSHILKTLCILLEQAGRTAAPEERQVLAQLQELQRSSTMLTGSPGSQVTSYRIVRELIESISFRMGGIPEEGAVHVSSLQSGGLSGRPFTFIVGVNEQSWHISPKQDPVLLDEERERISSYLRSSKEKSALQHMYRQERLGLIQGVSTWSCSAYNLAERREQYPAYEFLQLFRLKSGRMNADFEAMKEHLGPVVGYSPDYARPAVDEADIWMKQLITDQGQLRDGRAFLLKHYDHLQQGRTAIEAREEQLEVTAYDGMVETGLHGIEFGPGGGRALSASRLELYARCPMQFYYHEVLRIQPKEAPEFDRTRWLNAMERGSLLHEIFERYYAPWLEAEQEHDRERLSRITEEVLLAYEERIPAPSPQILRKEADSIRRDTEIFFKQEQERSPKPVHLELQLHEEGAPFELELSDELTLPLRGFIDRVDRVGPHQYRIVDYKTGKPSKYKEQDYFAGGTQLQHALYSVAARQWLRKKGVDPEAEVVEAAYYFPTEKGLGEEVVRLQNRKDELVQLLEQLLGSMKNGVFPPTGEPAHCTYCDYAEVCGKHAERMKDKDGERLRLLKEVYSHA